MTPDWHRRPVRALAAALLQGELTATALLRHYLDRIERLDPRLNAFIALDPEAAHAAAESERRLRAGRPRSVLEGIPVAVKDNLHMRGLPATWGSALYAGRPVAEDELPVARLRAAGAVLVGKTNVPEFALHGFTHNALFGATRNPWDPRLTPGGSSGGSAAAVAGGLVPLALCTDGGGSIRRPAAHTGLVGLKPSIGRVPRAGGFPALLLDCETVGPIARTTDDARLLLEAIAGPSRRDPRSRGIVPLQPPRERSGLRILWVPALTGHPVDPVLRARCAAALDLLQAQGHVVRQGELPFDIERVLAAWSELGGLGLAELARAEADFESLAAPPFVERARAAAQTHPARALEIAEILQAFRAEVGEAFASFDVIATPCTAAQPWPAEEEFPPVIAGRPVGPRGHAVFTGWVNACGHPAISVPVAPDAVGMPVGLQLVGDWGADGLLLDLAAQFEREAPWGQRWPGED